MNEKIKEFRQEIAKLEKEQKMYKPQRKTVKFNGERTIEPYDAVEVVKANKLQLRMMYAAYGLMRGKTFDQIESGVKHLRYGDYYRGTWVSKELDGKHPLCLYLYKINEWLEKYGYKLPYEEKENIWGGKTKKFDYENAEEVICLSKQEA